MSYLESEYEDGYRRLLCAVIIQAVRDMDSKVHQHEAAFFFTTDLFEWMADTLDMNPSELAKKIKTSEYTIPKRAAYHTSGRHRNEEHIEKK